MRLPWPFHLHSDRQAIIAEPFPAEWRPYLEANLLHYNLLTDDERTRLEGDLRVFMQEKYWEGATELDGQVTDEMKVTVSAHAILLTLGFAEHDYYPDFETVILYATGYKATKQTYIAPGSIIEGADEARLGEAHGIGPVVLSWEDVLEGSRIDNDGKNLALHEFAHKLDFENTTAPGVPRLDSDDLYDRWAKIMEREYEILSGDVEHHHKSLVNAYGATSPAEFFAVATEAFFEKSAKMKATHPELYDVLLGYYKIDWAERVEQSS